MNKVIFSSENNLKPEKYIIGNIFISENEFYILSQVERSLVCLISLKEGNRFRDPVKVSSVYYITQSEFNRIGNNNFKLVRKQFTVIPEKIYD